MKRLKWKVIAALARNKVTRPLMIRIFIKKWGKDFFGTYEGIPIVKSDYFTKEKNK